MYEPLLSSYLRICDQNWGNSNIRVNSKSVEINLI